MFSVKRADIPKFIADQEQKRPQLDYAIDGLVFSMPYDVVQTMGMTSGCPNGMLAFKFPPERLTSEVIDISYQLGRTGRIAPVCNIKPILLDGSMIARATLHNCANVMNLDIGPGAIVEIAKGGDIIPQVMKVVTRGLEAILPKLCPSCNAELIWSETEVDLLCENPLCPNQFKAFLNYWIKLMDIEEIGPKAIDALYESGKVNSIPDLLNLSKSDLRGIFGMGSKSTTIFKNLSALKEVPLWKFLCGLGIPELGKSTSKLVAAEFKTLNNLMGYVFGIETESCFEHIAGIGSTSSKYIFDGLRKSVDLQFELQKVLKVLSVEDASSPAGKLNGMSFCITGALPSGLKRSVVEDMIKKAGGELKSVSKGLTYLIQADASSTSGKTKKAVALGVEIIDETMLNKLLQ